MRLLHDPVANCVKPAASEAASPRNVPRSCFWASIDEQVCYQGDMLPQDVLEAIASVVSAAEGVLAERVMDGRDSEEPAMTSTLSNQLETFASESTDGGFDIKIRVLDSAGRGSSESLLGADMCVVLDVEISPGIRSRKGFLVQAKRSAIQDWLTPHPASIRARACTATGYGEADCTWTKAVSFGLAAHPSCLLFSARRCWRRLQTLTSGSTAATQLPSFLRTQSSRCSAVRVARRNSSSAPSGSMTSSCTPQTAS